MHSCLYNCTVTHTRLVPRKRRFSYKIFMFLLDIAEIDQQTERLSLFSRNRRNVYSFRDEDYLPHLSGDINTKARQCLKEMGLEAEPDRILLLTHVRTFGHIFNPVSFYFCLDANGNPLALLSEVTNTFGERKLYLLKPEDWNGNSFRGQREKRFYISPFIELEVDLAFKMKWPGERLYLAVSDKKDGKLIFHALLTGDRRQLASSQLLMNTLRFPLVTLKVVGGIYWHALILWVKKYRVFKKTERQDLQTDVILPHQPRQSHS